MSGVCFRGTREGVGREVGAWCAHPGLQLSDNSRATVNVLDCWSPEINAVISSWRGRVKSETMLLGLNSGHCGHMWQLQDSGTQLPSRLGELRPVSPIFQHASCDFQHEIS